MLAIRCPHFFVRTRRTGIVLAAVTVALVATSALAVDFEFGAGRDGSYTVSGTKTVQEVWAELAASASMTYDPLNAYQVPNFENLIIDENSSLTAESFSGDPSAAVDSQDGGILRLRVNGTLWIKPGGRIDVSGRGYHGGIAGAVADQKGVQGDSWGMVGANDRVENRGGGGGGLPDPTVGGGGGGGNATAGTGGGGGRTGLAGLSFDTVAQSQDPSFRGNYPFPRFGSGGGGGGFVLLNANAAAVGGSGGGVIVIEAAHIINQGTMSAEGSGGGTGISGGGGGGGGGVWIRTLSSETRQSGTVTVKGGSGGVSNPPVGEEGFNGGTGGLGEKRWETQYEVAPTVEGNGRVVVTPVANQFIPGTLVTLEAKPDDGWCFKEWTVGASGVSRVVAVSLTDNLYPNAIFEVDPGLRVLPIDEQTVRCEGGTVYLQVTGSKCEPTSWTAIVQEGVTFITLAAGGTGTISYPTSSTISLVLPANQTGLVRTGSILVTDTDPLHDVSYTIPIRQLNCRPVLDVRPTDDLVPSAGGVRSYGITNKGEGLMAWNAVITSGANFMTLGNTNGTGNGALSVTVSQNLTAGPRVGTIEVQAPDGGDSSPKIITITQANNTPVLDVRPTTDYVTSAGGPRYFSITNKGEGTMTWNAVVTSGANFLTLGTTNGTGNATLAVTVLPNQTSGPRVGTIEVQAPDGGVSSPKIITINQANNTPILDVMPTEDSVSSTGGSRAYTIANKGDGVMAWNAVITSGANFLTLGNTNGTGNATLSVTVGPNLGSAPRTGTIEVRAPDGGVSSPKTITITQANSSPVLDVRPLEDLVSCLGGARYFTITNRGEGVMAWNAVILDGANFMTLATTNGTGNASLSVTLAPNLTASTRTGTIEVQAPDGGVSSPKTITITQDKNSPVLDVGLTEDYVSSLGGSRTYTISNKGQGVMDWNAAVISGANFITLNNSNGTGAGALSVTIGPNLTSSPRTGSIEVRAPGAGVSTPKTITITQANSTPALDVRPVDDFVPCAGASRSYTITNKGEGNMPWSAVITAGSNFLTLGAVSGTGTGALPVTIAPNLTSLPRVGTIEIQAPDAVDSSPKVITITQAKNSPILYVTPTEDLALPCLGGVRYYTLINKGEGVMAWNAIVTSGSGFLTVGTSSGVGAASLSVTVAANATSADRTGTIEVRCPDGGASSPQVITITQSKITPILSLALTEDTISSTGGSRSYSITNLGECTMPWSAEVTTGDNFLTLANTSGTGAGALSVTIAPNLDSSPRIGTITVTAPDGGVSSPQTITITQNNSRPVLDLRPLEDFVPCAGGARSFTITNKGEGAMPWNVVVTTGGGFLTLGASSGTGSGTLSVTVAPNLTSSARTGTVEVQAPDGGASSPQTITITQAKNSPSLDVSPQDDFVPCLGGARSYTIANKGEGVMAWNAVVTSGGGFLALGASSGTGPAALSVTVAPNPTSNSRSGTIEVRCPDAGASSPKIITISQAKIAPLLDLGLTEDTVSSAGGTRSYTITNIGECAMPWAAEITSGANFLSLANSSGNGSGTLSVTIGQNLDTTPRIGTIEVTAPDAGVSSPKTITITQTNARPVLDVRPVDDLVPCAGGARSYTITNRGEGAMAWNAVVTDGPGFLTLPTNSGSGTATLSVTVAPNLTSSERTGTIEVQAPDGGVSSPKTITITQAKNSPVLDVTPLEDFVPCLGATHSFTIANRGEGAMPWNAVVTSGGGFLTLGASSGSGPGTLSVTVAENKTPDDRVGTVEIQAPDAGVSSPKIITITQSKVSPVLDVSPEGEVFVSCDEAPVTLNITNKGEGSMTWSAIVTGGADDFLALPVSSGIGAAALSVTVKQNRSSGERTGTIEITAPDAVGSSPKVITIRQGFIEPILSVAPVEQRIGGAGGTVPFTVGLGGARCTPWRAMLLSGMQYNMTVAPVEGPIKGAGDASVTVTAPANDRPEERRAEMKIMVQPDDLALPLEEQTVVIYQDPCLGPPPPTNVTASDGKYVNGVKLLWTPSQGATQYQIFRSEASNFKDALLIATTATPTYVDTTALYPDVEIVGRSCFQAGEYLANYRVYYYWVRALNSCAGSEPSDPNTGYRDMIRRIAPQYTPVKSNTDGSGTTVSNTTATPQAATAMPVDARGILGDNAVALLTLLMLSLGALWKGQKSL